VPGKSSVCERSRCAIAVVFPEHGPPEIEKHHTELCVGVIGPEAQR